MGEMKPARAFMLVPLAVICFSTTAHARWQIQYTGAAAKMFGSAPRGNFATKQQCMDYWRSRPGFERNNSHCVGSDDAVYSRPQQRRPRPPRDFGRVRPGVKRPRPGFDQAWPGFEEGKGELLGQFKGGGGGVGLGLKGSGGQLLLKPGNVPSPRPRVARTTPPRAVSKEPEVRQEQLEFERFNAAWMRKQKRLLALRQANPCIPAIYRSLKTKAPPALPRTKYDELQPGDVLLISADGSRESFWINLADRVSSVSKSPASHTVLYLKTVNGKKLFLDHTSEKGSHVISEAEFLKTYGRRDALVASVAKPVKEGEASRIWEAARERVKAEAKGQERRRKKGKIIDQSGYGLYGDDDMVCSEASRWVLLRAGRKIQETSSPLKRLMGIHYGPANFFDDEQNFIITPLWAPTAKK